MRDTPLPEVQLEPTPADTDILEAERDKHRKRAERFGTQYVEPGKRSDLKEASKKERLQKPGFTTGIDLFSQEETQKRQGRAARFGEAPSTLSYEPIQPIEDMDQLRARAERFNMEFKPPDLTGLATEDLLEQRRLPGRDVERRPTAIHLYGVDLMSTAECLGYFAEWGPTFCEWINDSSCNVTFQDEDSAKRAMVSKSQPLPPEDPAMLAGLEVSDISNLPYLWHKGQPFLKPLGKQQRSIPLLLRMATAEDVKPTSGPHQTRRLWVQNGKASQGTQKRRQRPDPASQGAAATQGRGSRGKRRRKIRMPLADGSFQPGAAEEGPEDADMMDIDDAVDAPWNEHETLAERQDPPDYGMSGGMRSDQIMAIQQQIVSQQMLQHQPEVQRELVSYSDVLDGP